MAEEEAALEGGNDEKAMVPRPTNGEDGRFRRESAQKSQPHVTNHKANDRLLNGHMEGRAKTKHARRSVPGSFPEENGE
jgi:hypothetical protein